MSSALKTILALVVLVIIGGGAYYYWSQGDAMDQTSTDAMTIQFGNNSYDALKSVEISPAGTEAYVAIPLTDGTLGAGEFYAHAITDGATICTYDLRATKENGQTANFKGVNLCDQPFYHFEDVGYE